MAFNYSTQPFLAWCLNRYFYHDKHFFHVADCFYPCRTNPKSSNPLEIYRDLYHPWEFRDPFDKFVLYMRLAMCKAVQKQQDMGTITGDLAGQLKLVCEKVEIIFFYPVVYRVEMDRVPKDLLEVTGSGLTGSKEYFIDGLDEHLGAFEIIFLDFLGDSDLNALKGLPVGDSSTALAILKSRCRA